MKIRIALALLSLTAPSVTAQTTFHANNARTGAYQSRGPKELKGVKWQFKTQGAIVSSPGVANGVVYIGSSDGALYAIDQKNGQQKWKAQTRGPVASSPAIADGLVFFLSYDGGLYCLDANTGSRKWRFATTFERRFEAKRLHGSTPSEQTVPDPHDVFLSSPLVFNGRVYFGSSDGNIYALEEKTGILQWKFETKGIVHASPALAAGTIYIGSWDSYLYALDAETGTEKWRFKTGEDPIISNQVGFQSSPAVVDGVVYVGCRDAHLYAIDAQTGRKKWDYPTSKSWVNVTPAVFDGSVYFATGDTRRFHALDAKTGRLRFTVPVLTVIFSSPAIADGLAYFGNLNGSLYAVNIKTGAVAWEFQTEASKNDILKFLNPDRTRKDDVSIFGFNDFEDMYVYWYKNFSLGAIVSSPVVDQGEVYFGSTDGNLYALY
jgi:eukaryotic-like serine/threonine-protein kinase